jgi:gliding motility-associated protein GldM
MAGGKLSPRQKMINLMYLVFISMLAMNMSKEVLSAFGLMNERLEQANVATSERNAAFMAGLNEKVSENEELYGEMKQKADRIGELSNELDTHIEGLKSLLMSNVKPGNEDNYEMMDKPDYLDRELFMGANYSQQGQEFIDKINSFREGVVALISDQSGFEPIVADVNRKFSTEEETRRDGVKVDWLRYHFEGFPMVASLTKLTQMQADIRTTNSDILTRMLEGELTDAISMSNYTTLLQASRSAYFQGDTFDGSVVVGRTDAITRPSRAELTLNGRPLAEGEYTLQGGGVKLNVNAGAPGDYKIEGNLIFAQGGEEIPVPVDLGFTTISRPTDAIISADKMNVVYRGVQNPMTISMSGVSDNNITANAPGLRRASGSSYIMDVTTVQGREVTINVSGTIDGTSYPSRATFRIKDIPRPVGTVRGEDGLIKMQRNALEISTIGAMIPDFDFDVNLNVTGFKFNVPGQPTVVVNGSRLNDAAKNTLRRARRGETVQIFDITANLAGASGYRLQRISPVFVELTN